MQKLYSCAEDRLLQTYTRHSTRWNSTCFLFDQIFEQQKAIVNYILERPNLLDFDATK